MIEPSASTPDLLRFGSFELDPRTGELRNKDRRINLPDQPLQVLLALLNRPGQLVTRDEFRQRLWPGDTFVDFEHALNAAVKRLRDALGDSADTPRFVETLPRRGYRFIGPVEGRAVGTDVDQRQPERPEPTRSASPTPTADRAGSWTRPRLLMVAAAMAALIGFGWWTVRPSRGNRSDPTPSATPIHRELTKVTFGPGLQTDVTWSPDGQRIAYASDKTGNFDIWVQPVGGGPPTPLTTSPDDDTQPAWGPDGSSIAFRSEQDGGGVFLVPALGGAARKLTAFGVHPAWMPDGRDIFIRRGLEGFTRAYLVSVSGDQPPREILSEFMKDGRWEWMAPHPDGRISMLGSHRTHGWGFYTVSRDGREVTVVKPPQAMLASFSGEGDHHPTRHFYWTPLGNALYVEVAANQIWSLWRVAVAPTTLQWLSAERLTTGADHARSPAISPDGKRIAFASHHSSTRAYVFPFDAVAGRLQGEGQPVTEEDTMVLWPSLSRDGRSLLYTAQRTGTDRVDAVKTNLETGETTMLTRGGNQPIESPDGTRYVYWLTRRPKRDTDPPVRANAVEYAIALRDRTGSERLVSRWSGQVLMGATDWTRGSEAVIGSYIRTDATGPVGPVPLVLWRLTGDIPEKPERVLLEAPGRRFWQPTYSPDWRWISFVAERIDRPDMIEMGVIPASGTRAANWTRIAADHEWPDKPRWAPDGRTLYFLSRKPAGYLNLWGVRMDPALGSPLGEPFQVTSFASPALIVDPNAGTSEIDVRGRRLLLVMRKTTGNIWMLSGVDR